GRKPQRALLILQTCLSRPHRRRRKAADSFQGSAKRGLKIGGWIGAKLIRRLACSGGHFLVSLVVAPKLFKLGAEVGNRIRLIQETILAVLHQEWKWTKVRSNHRCAAVKGFDRRHTATFGEHSLRRRHHHF